MLLEGALEVGMRGGVEGFEGVGFKHKIEKIIKMNGRAKL